MDEVAAAGIFSFFMGITLGVLATFFIVTGAWDNDGKAKQDCFANSTCRTGLECLSGVCVDTKPKGPSESVECAERE